MSFDLMALLYAAGAIAAITGLFVFALLGIGVYLPIRTLSKPLAKGISKLTLVQEKKSVSRLLPSSLQ
ncbi:MAG: hypothetical protein ACRDHZ_24555, partial [Ktedonobacteraceae bacterium]